MCGHGLATRLSAGWLVLAWCDVLAVLCWWLLSDGWQVRVVLGHICRVVLIAVLELPRGRLLGVCPEGTGWYLELFVGDVRALGLLVGLGARRVDNALKC